MTVTGSWLHLRLLKVVAKVTHLKKCVNLLSKTSGNGNVQDIKRELEAGFDCIHQNSNESQTPVCKYWQLYFLPACTALLTSADVLQKQFLYFNKHCFFFEHLACSTSSDAKIKSAE